MTCGAILALTAASVYGVRAWNKQYKHYFFPRQWGEVEEGRIYRSGQLPEGLARRVFAEHDLDVVIALNDPRPGPERDDEARLCAELGIEHRRYPLRGDGTGRLDRYVDALAALHEAETEGRRVLVHCSAGVERTGGILAVYRLLIQRSTTPEGVRDEMASYGWQKKDKAVIAYANENMAEIARRLVERGVLAGVPDPLPRLLN